MLFPGHGEKVSCERRAHYWQKVASNVNGIEVALREIRELKRRWNDFEKVKRGDRCKWRAPQKSTVPDSDMDADDAEPDGGLQKEGQAVEVIAAVADDDKQAGPARDIRAATTQTDVPSKAGEKRRRKSIDQGLWKRPSVGETNYWASGSLRPAWGGVREKVQNHRGPSTNPPCTVFPTYPDRLHTNTCPWFRPFSSVNPTPSGFPLPVSTGPCLLAVITSLEPLYCSTSFFPQLLYVPMQPHSCP